MNAREGIKTNLAHRRSAPERFALKTMNAREGIKTLLQRQTGQSEDGS